MLKQHLNDYSNVVALGGGHGLGRVLASLSFLGPKLTGIVTTTDNGGSTGRLREDQNTIAWGDLRNCLSHLAMRPSIGTMLFDHRFSAENELSGHNLGNLILHALDQLCVRPLEAVNLIRSLLNIETRIIPMSEQSTNLIANNLAGGKVFGEVNVDDMDEMPVSMLLEPAVEATCEAVQALTRADVIIIGPGSFVTSIIPPLLLPSISQAIHNSTARIIFINNLTCELSPAGKTSLEDRIDWCNRLIGKEAITDVITNGDVKDLGEYVSYFPLVSSHHPGLHNKLALADALNEVLTRN